MPLGSELREARERLGLSRAQISSTTKIQIQKIAALEEDRFDELPTGIYLKGIAAGYARAVGIDADDVVRRLTAIVAPPAPPTLEQIATTRERHHEPGALPMRFSPVHGMAAFALVAAALGLLGVGVHLFPHASTPAAKQFVAVARRPEAVAPARPERRTVKSAPRQMPAASDGLQVAGLWRLETTIQSSSLRTFEGLRLGYQLELQQEDGRIVGTGRKVTENGVELQRGRQTPIAVRGTIDGGHLSLIFGERGARRASQGIFNLVLENADRLRGRFSSDAARSAGVVEATRL